LSGGDIRKEIVAPVESFWRVRRLLSVRGRNDTERGKAKPMLYTKNVPMGERLLRVLSGAALIAYGVIGRKGGALGYLVAGSGGVAVLTGFVGFCPMCALAGRRIRQSIEKSPGEKPW